MACTTWHTCQKCGWGWQDNAFDSACPSCGDDCPLMTKEQEKQFAARINAKLEQSWFETFACGVRPKSAAITK